MLALTAALITAAVALLVAYWHRKQARQIELFRLDQSVGLEPPPSAVWRFLVRHQEFLTALLTIVLPIVGLTIFVLSREPITRFAIVGVVLNSISLSIGISFLTTNALQKQIRRIVDNLDGTVRLINDLNAGSYKAMDGIIDLIKSMNQGSLDNTRTVLGVIDKVNEINDKSMRALLDLITLRNKGTK